MRFKYFGFAAVALAGVVLAQQPSRDITIATLTQLGADLVALLEGGAEGLDAATRERVVPSIALWVTGLRDDALERGVAAMPKEMRDILRGYVPPEVLDRVRWRIDGDANIAGQNLFQLGGVRALTLDNVILFADAKEAADPTLWAHELYHVMQFAQWGIDGFVDRYLTDRHAVEHEAWEFRWAWMKATGRVPSV